MEKNASIYREKKVTNGKIKISLVVNCQSPGFVFNMHCWIQYKNEHLIMKIKKSPSTSNKKKYILKNSF